MSHEVPLILDCAKLPPDLSSMPISFRSFSDEFYAFVGGDYPKRIFKVFLDDRVGLAPVIDDSVLLNEVRNLKRELLGSSRSAEEPIAINWGQRLAGIFPRGDHVLVYTPLTGLIKFKRVYHNADDSVAAIVGCNQRRCTAVVWDPLTGESAEYDIELKEPRYVSCCRGLCVINAREESVVMRPGINPIYLPLTPSHPLASCGGNNYLMYRSSEGGFVIKATSSGIDPLVPIEGMPSAACFNDSLILCTSVVGCGILKERLWMSLTNRFYTPFSATEIATLNSFEDKEVVLVNSTGIVTSIKSRLCVPNNEGLLLCLSDGYIVASSAHTLIKPSIEVPKNVVDAKTYAMVKVRPPGRCSEVEVIGDVSGHRLEKEGVLHLYLRPVRLGDTVSPVVLVRSPLMEFARKITVISSAPRLDSFVIEKAVASVAGRIADEPRMNALITGHATILKTSPGTWNVSVIAPPGFKINSVYAEDSSIRFSLIGRSRPNTAVPISFELVDEIGTKYVIPGTVIMLGEARIDRVVRNSMIEVRREGIEAPGRVRILCADGRTIEPSNDEPCFLPSLVEAVLVEDGFEAEITRVISCSDSIIPKNFRCVEVNGGIEKITISGDGVLRVSGSVGLTVTCAKTTEAGKDVEIRLDPFDLVNGCRVYHALESPRPIIITRDELVRSALLAAVITAEKLSSEVRKAND